MAFPSNAELIVLAAPLATDTYYADLAEDIFDFHIAFVDRIGDGDEVIILADAGAYDRYADAVGEDRVALAPMQDIWMRDFAPINPDGPIMFRYTAEGQGGGTQGQESADFVQDGLVDLAGSARLSFRGSPFLNDGGNFVEDHAGNAVVSRKFLSDNGLSEPQARKILRDLTKVRNVAFIEADAPAGLQHADGIVSFVDVNMLLVNAYPDDPSYARRLRADLRRGLPGVEIHEIVTPYDGRETNDERFASACGLYVNALVTPSRVYFPQFGIPEDRVALERVRAVTSREVIPVPSGQVCSMGGGVRCMSWQLRGKNASKLKAHFD